MSEFPDPQEIIEALELAVGADDPAITGPSFLRKMQSTSSPKRITGAREVIKRFCEYLPGDTTAADILMAIERHELQEQEATGD